MFEKIIRTSDSKAIVLIRLMVGSVFLSEGIQKFLFATLRGAGRFEKIGLPWPHFLGTFVGSFEIVCGLFILLGIVTRLAVVPVIIIMFVALISTKIPILLNDGFWLVLHAARTDWAMLLGSIFLLIEGAGNWSFDWRWGK